MNEALTLTLLLSKQQELVALLEKQIQMQSNLIKTQDNLITLLQQKHPTLSFVWRLLHGRA